MISITSQDLERDSFERLKSLQDDVDRLPNYEAQVAYAKSSWKNKPASLFTGLKTQLSEMCSGNLRCVYCEDSLADEIEHMRPKDLYPEQSYVWGNYVLACGPCNGPKNNRFAVLGNPTMLMDVTRKRNDPVVEPTQGRYALIDPRVEDPLEFLWLDFRTFRYVSNSDDDDSEISIRAEYTVDVLGLNKRDALVRGRKSAFSGYTSRLRSWVEWRTVWNHVEQLEFIDDFRADRYRGVWERMKRYRNDLPVLREVADLINDAPEVLDW